MTYRSRSLNCDTTARLIDSGLEIEWIGSVGGFVVTHPLRDVYTAGPPPRLPEMFVGRDRQIGAARDILLNTDKHLLVTGQRGIGKTSFCQRVRDLVPMLLGEDWHAHHLVVHSEASLQSFFGDLLSRIGISKMPHESKGTVKGEGSAGVDLKVVRLGGSAGVSRDQVDRYIEIDPFSPNQVLEKVRGRHLIIIDEFDLLAKTPAGEPLALRLMELAKAAADLRHPGTAGELRFVFAGLTHRASELFRRHDSIGRYIDDIKLQRITRTDCEAFFASGERLSGIAFHPVVRGAIVDDSSGYPYFLQEVASHCCRVASNAGRSVVELAHYTTGLEDARRAVERAQNVRFYEDYVRLGAVEKAVLDMVALSRYAEISFNKVRVEVARRGSWSEKAVAHSIEVLVRSDVFLYHARDRDQLGFVEPFFQGYLKRKIRGPVQSKRISTVAATPIEQMKFQLD